MSKKRPNYPTLYEEWLVQYKNAKSDLERSLSSETGLPDEHQQRHILSKLMIARVGKLASIQSAIADDKDNNHDVDGLSLLWEQTMWELDKDCASGSHTRMLNEIMRRPEIGKDVKFDNIHNDNDSGQDAADAFFDDYPECAQSYSADTDDDDDDDDDEESDDEDASQKNQPYNSKSTHPPIHPAKLPSAVPGSGQPDLQQPHHSNNKAHSERIASAPPRNPYAKTKQNSMWIKEQHDTGPVSQHGINGNTVPTTWEDQTQKVDGMRRNIHKPANHSVSNSAWGGQDTSMNSSWDNAQNTQNPFQTARDYAHSDPSGKTGNDNDGYEQQRAIEGGPCRHPNQYNDSYGPRDPYQRQPNNPYDPQQEQSNNPSRQPIQGPNIRDSLKRKFQPPKRNPEEAKRKESGGVKQERGSTKRSGQSGKGGGGGTSSRPSSSCSISSDDDELPEELRGLDKELVDKIMNEIIESGQPVTFKDIAGLEDAKAIVNELVIMPMKRPDIFTGLRKVPNGLLLFGPPGTGKTLIGKAIAHQSGATFFSISSSSLTSKWIGEGEKLVRTLFAVAAYRQPSVVFIDEIDSLLTQRKADENEASRRIKTEFLVQLDGTGTSGQGQVLVIGATNRPHELDDAARRRFVKRLYIPLPEQKDREILLRTLVKKNSHSLTDQDFHKISTKTNGFSGADLSSLCTDAAMGPIRQLGSLALEIDPKDVPPITFKHFRKALRGTNPSVAQADLKVYIDWNNTYGSKSTTLEDDEDSEDDDDDN